MSARAGSRPAAQLLSKRAAAAQAKINFSRTCVYNIAKNKYDADTNPTGIINLGFAENFLNADLWQKKFSSPDMLQFQPFMQYYFQYGGIPSFRKALADFFTKRFGAKRPVSEDHILVSSGCGSAMDYLAFSLADEEDHFLLFTPCYYAIPLDFSFRQRVGMVEVALPSQDRDDALAYEQNVKDLRRAYEQAIEEGKKIRGVILVNPHNPTGNIVRMHKMKEIVDFCAENQLHVISNELYALSCFDENSHFESLFSLDHVPDPERLHILWGFSKDFGLSGLRCGVIYSRNNLITRDRGSLEHSFYLGSVPSLVQEQLRLVVTDDAWLDKEFFPTNLKRMRENYGLFEKTFNELDIPFYQAGAGYFVFANFGKYLTSKTKEAEMEFFEKLLGAGLYIFPGVHLFCTEPGWFRITFTLDTETVKTSLKRISTFIETLG